MQRLQLHQIGYDEYSWLSVEEDNDGTEPGLDFTGVDCGEVGGAVLNIAQVTQLRDYLTAWLKEQEGNDPYVHYHGCSEQ